MKIAPSSVRNSMKRRNEAGHIASASYFQRIVVDFLRTLEYNEITNERKGVDDMASSVLQVRVDESLRAQAAAIYEDLGIDLQTAVRIFLKRSVRENGLPFGMTLTEKKATTVEAGIKAIESMRETAEKAGVSGMSIDEINAEIAAARAERRARKTEDGE